MLRRLNLYYERHGILPDDFRCASYSACSAGSPKFTEAKASHVGPRYGERGVPRLLFLSLDSGSAQADPRLRTAEAVRRRNLALDVAQLPRNKHWYRTHEMAFELLRRFKPGLTVGDTPLYFAHVNSAKCCQNKSERSQADKVLFENCRRFIPGELRLLRPDVVVTQGGWAEEAVRRSFDIQEHRRRGLRVEGYKLDARYETGLIELGAEAGTALWLHTYHPNNYGRFNPQRKGCWPLYADEVGRFWRSRET